jgi:UDP-N-acetylmuramyl tripeptide synthase
MRNRILTLSGKLLSNSVRQLNLGNGSTWPGHVALKANPRFISQTLQHSGVKTILVAGTNGKTTTSAMIATILEGQGKKVLKNTSGANLLNGIASALILQTNKAGRLEKDYAIFEVDENALPLILKQFVPDYIVLLNLFRDQLDRYGELNTIARKWQESIAELPETTALILNADDPQIAYLGQRTKATSHYYGLQTSGKKNLPQEHAVDSLYCPRCGEKLQYTIFNFSHLGDWQCAACKLKRPTAELDNADTYPLPGMYNKYNTHAALLLVKTLNISLSEAKVALKKFTPVFGRQEEIVLNGKKIRLFLSKNPTGFNESLRTIKELGAEHIMFILNDRIPDGHDVSWIWDTDIENILTGSEHISSAGDRAYDMALRLKYAHPVVKHVDTYFPKLADGLESALSAVPPDGTLFILPTYTAMLETRKIITGKKIL